MSDARKPAQRPVGGLPPTVIEIIAQEQTQWQSTPSTPDGKPVKVIHILTVRTNLQ